MKIKSVTTVRHLDNVFDIELERNHWFFANGVLTHNCRLKSGIEDNVFSYTLGAGGLRTGSKKVITINVNRITQDWDKAGRQEPLEEYIGRIVDRVHKYLISWNDWLKFLYDANLLTVYKAGFIALEDQYLTVGINGAIDAAEYLGIEPRYNNQDYVNFMSSILTKIKSLNIRDRDTMSTEYVIEHDGVKYSIPATACFYAGDKYLSIDYIIKNNIDVELDSDKLAMYKID